jgi:hypothetical protein
MNHHICKSAKRTVAGARVKCYSLLVETKVLSMIVGALAALVMLAFSRTLNAEQITVLKNVNVIDGTGAPGKCSKQSAVTNCYKDVRAAVLLFKGSLTELRRRLDSLGQLAGPLLKRLPCLPRDGPLMAHRIVR